MAAIYMQCSICFFMKLALNEEKKKSEYSEVTVAEHIQVRLLTL